MCLIAIAHRASSRFPLLIAANRDEDYERPAFEVAPWPDAPEVIGGRDAVAGGSWLAITRGGRFAAVTNLRGALRKTRSRGELVRRFVMSDIDPQSFAEDVAREADEYAGFHLLIGEADRSLVYVDSAGEGAPLEPGIHAFSNAARGESWPKVGIAIEAMERALAFDEPSDELLRFLTTRRNASAIESEVFVAGDRYGTRSSTVIVATAEELRITEQIHGRGGVSLGSSSLRSSSRT
jgi:uncharacterized protein with NRDE domain